MLEVVVLAVVVQMEVALAPQEAQAELHQAEVAAVVSPILARAALEEQEPEARCVYGPGNSEYGGAIWPGCAET